MKNLLNMIHVSENPDANVREDGLIQNVHQNVAINFYEVHSNRCFIVHTYSYKRGELNLQIRSSIRLHTHVKYLTPATDNRFELTINTSKPFVCRLC